VGEVMRWVSARGNEMGECKN